MDQPRIFFGIVFVDNGIARVLPAVPDPRSQVPIGFVVIDAFEP